MKIAGKLVLAVLTLGALALATPALADSHGKAAPSDNAEQGKAAQGNAGQGKAWGSDPSAEDRAKMADAHQRMAECLRSSRPMKECRDEMKKAHAGFGHGQDCPHGEACPKHGGHHGGMSEKKGQGAPTVDAETSEAATPKSKPNGKPKTN